MDRFYGDNDSLPAAERVPGIREALFGKPPAAHVLLAWEETQLVGFAAYSFLWPAAGVTRSLYLKELYVVEEGRRKGVGRLLMRQLSKIATDTGCSRVEWTADMDNPIAQRFYATLGVPVHPSKVFYRLDGEALTQIANTALGDACQRNEGR